MIKKINNYIFLSIFISFFILILGGVCIFYPDLSFNVVTSILIILFIITGIALLIIDYQSDSILMSNFINGILSIVIGIILWMNPEALKVILPIGVGIWFIMSALVNMRFFKYFKTESMSYAMLSIICDFVAIICGVVLICQPLETSNILMNTLGITMIFYAVTNIVDMFIVKKYVKKIFKNIKKYVTEFIN